MAVDAVWSPQWISIAFAAVLRASMLLAAGAVLAFLVRGRPAHVVAGLWALILAVLVPLPWMRELPFAWRLDALPGILTIPIATAGRTMVLQSSAAAARVPWTTLVAAAWMIGAVLVAAHSIIRVWRFHAVARRALPMDVSWDLLLTECCDISRCTRAVRIRVSDEALVPFAIGVARPTIVLPASAVQWSCSHARSVLLHELAHIKRYDVGTGVLAQCACVMWWFHPAVWYGTRALCRAREHACDAEVLRSGVVPSDYAECLLVLSDSVQGIEPRAASLCAPHFLRRSSLDARIRAILNSPGQRTAPVHAGLVAVAIVAIAVTTGSMKVAPSPSSLWPMLDSGDWAGRAYAAETIARIGDTEEVARLNVVLRTERNSRVHAHARYGAYLKRCAEIARAS